MRRNLLIRDWKWPFVLLLLLFAQVSQGQTGNGISIKRILNGATGQLAQHSIVTVQDSLFFDPSLISKLDTPYQVRNVVTFSINEYAPLYLPDSFTATANVRIYYTKPDESEGSIDQTLVINYDTSRPYTMRSSFVFSNAHKVRVEILNITTNAQQDILPALFLENLMEVHPVYKLSCTDDAVKSIWSDNPPNTDTTGEVTIGWPGVAGLDAYDLEWAYVDQNAIDDGKYGTQPDPKLIFDNNATRVTIADNNYVIPLLYGVKGVLFFRVRGVQEKDGYRRMETNWSSDYGGGLGSYAFVGHEKHLNWKSVVDFSEDGKRKAVVQYLDGSLRERQTVTKDNTTNNTLVAETFYDYQGRPAVDVLPAPTLNTVMKYAHNLNKAMNGAEYDKDQYDHIASKAEYLSASAKPMDSTSGANQYYSANNPEKNTGINQYIPAADGYAFSETEYMQDKSDRIRRKGTVGKTFQLGSGHESTYFYGTASQEDLYALFGTEVGDNTHYFKDMVSDGNGQFQVSYKDMHGHVIATALAGSPQYGNLDDLPSKEVITVTDSLSGTGKNTIRDLSFDSRHTHTVTQNGTYTFTYELDPPVLKKANCKDSMIAYPGLYDLEIRISDDAYNQHLHLGGQPFDTVLHNYKIDSISTSGKKLQFSFDIYLEIGNYDFTKRLSISKAGLEYYRDSIFLQGNVCTTLEKIIEEQKLIQHKDQCVPDCESCKADVGDWDDYRVSYVLNLGHSIYDTTYYRAEAWMAFQNELSACKELCGEVADIDKIRAAMLLDMTPPSGQYADLSDSTGIYSIYYRVPNKEDDFAPYSREIFKYVDETGALDKVYDEYTNTYVIPQQLSPEQFSAQFKSSWADSLLRFHPEYCQLLVSQKFRDSELWDAKFSAVESYKEAKEKGYLNPMGLPEIPFTAVDKDPLSLPLDAGVQKSLQARLRNYTRVANAGAGNDMWSIATGAVMCNSGDQSCMSRYNSPAAAFNEDLMCTGDLDMAWRSFRSLYLTAKKEIIDSTIIAAKCPVSAGTLSKAGKESRFSNNSDGMADAGYGGLFDGPLSEEKSKADAAKLADSAYEANCRVYVDYWLKQLAPCKYDASALSQLTEDLVKVCKSGSDVDHPNGSSTVKPGSNNPYQSFEAVLNAYNWARGITDPLVCNTELITIPKPYDKQQPISDTRSFSKPDNCQCEKLAALQREYVAKKRFGDFNLSQYIRRTRKVTIRQSDLDLLANACNGGSSNSSCQWLSKEILIPALLQCNAGSACVSCEEVNTLYSSFKATYPTATPVMVTEDSAQQKVNELFANYMNNRLGFSKQAWEYLSFMTDSCNGIPAGDGVTVCNEGPASMKQMVSRYSNGGNSKINDIARSSDNGYVLAGWTTGSGAGGKDGYIIKTDSTGGVLWSRSYGGTQEDELIRLKRTKDSGYIGIGNTYSYCYDKGAILILKLDKSGVTQWSQAVDFGLDNGARGSDIIETSEGNYAFSGLRLTGTTATNWVTGVLSDSGYLKWMKQIGSSSSKETIGLTESGDTLLAGTSIKEGADYDAVILKQDKASGALQDVLSYDLEGVSNVTGNILLSSTGYKLSVNNNGTGALLDISRAGNVVGAKKISTPGVQVSNGWTAAGINGGGVIAAQSLSSPSGDVYWHNLDAGNHLLWSRHVRMDGNEILYRLLSNTNGTFAGAGTYNGTDAMLMLTDNTGRTGCKDTLETIAGIDITGSSIRKTLNAQTTSSLGENNMSHISLLEGMVTVSRSVISCPGTDSCYVIGNGPLLCGSAAPIFEETDINTVTGCTDSTYFAESAGNVLYKAYVDSVKNDFEASYIQAMMEAGAREKFAVRYQTSEYHYTLYYYDQAGNLVKTIPPAGVVKKRSTEWVDSVKAAIEANERLVPPHTMATEYRYNTLNEVVAQKTPDAGISKFWYDRLGRVAVSQNNKQKLTNSYGYIVYDDLDRKAEIGQLRSGVAITDEISNSKDDLATWMNNAADTRAEIIRSTYDIAYPFFKPAEFVGRNLRNRLSWMAKYDNVESLINGTHNFATFFTYDIHGGADTILQDYRIGNMEAAGNRFKKITYQYDQMSGRIMTMAYQEGRPDAFYHRYLYDAENRLINVQTSKDKLYWENDAYYQYYRHDQQARVVLGQLQVQGIDYAYTLQGWLKGVNSTTLSAGQDQGNDGNNGAAPKDVFGFALHYYGDGDYRPINSTKRPFAAATGNFGPSYNGNIAAISQHLSPLGNPLSYNYHYDVLNRVKGMQAYSGLDLETNTWTPLASDNYKEAVTYDGNGNILNYKRNGNNAGAGAEGDMDNLSYHYIPGTNKLDFIDDAATATYENDLKKQLSGNYEYDSIGNLTKDNAAGISNITWNFYGKIASISKTNGTTIRYTYDANGNRISKDVDGTQTWYVRDLAGNILSTYTSQRIDTTVTLTLSEVGLYGTKRLGMMTPELDMKRRYDSTTLTGLGAGIGVDYRRGIKTFELNNHLGNVLATVSDKRIPRMVDNTLHYDADIVSAQEYYPFGMLMPGRTWESDTYRFGFNGKENDNDVKGMGNQQDYGLRVYDPRAARFLSIDPLTMKYAMLTPYQFASNRPINGIDLDGAEYLSEDEAKKLYPPALPLVYTLTPPELKGYEVKQYKGKNYYKIGQHLKDRLGKQVTEWIYESITPVIPQSGYVGYYDPSLPSADCLNASKATIAKLGLEVVDFKSGIQMYKAGASIGMEQRMRAIDVIQKTLEEGKAIIVGVDYKSEQTANQESDNTTDHFIVIVGRGNDEKGDFFTFYDNAVNNSSTGADEYKNKLYVQSDGTLKAESVYYNHYNYTVTQVRPSVEKKEEPKKKKK